MSEFTDLLQKSRLQKNMSKKDAANVLGWTPMYYGRYENGYLKPTKTNIHKFADFIGITEKELESIINESIESE